MSAAAPTRLDRAAAPTRLDSPGAARSVFNLPSRLADHWRIVRPIAARGAEADLFVVARVDDGTEAVAKLYRTGMRPPSAALERVRAALAAHVVTVLEHGESDGIAYELMEYCPLGSLRDQANADPRRVLEELAAALAHLHEAGIIHRDLKPENVLVRSREPLDLVLTDFGIASFAAGTQHFTSTSRTVRYAPPEAMSGVLSVKADYWSLGMMLVELLTGRHPFEGLSEAVINHQLITRPVDVEAVADPAWRGLVRGLLLRDPQARFGAVEIARWLASDPTLDLNPVDTAENAVRPYEIEGTRCTTAHALGLALVRHWHAGTKDLARGLVLDWVRTELRDRNLARFMHDLADETGNASPETRLVRFALHVAPGMPPVWRGLALDDDTLRREVARALAGEADAADWLASLYRAEVHRLYCDDTRLAALAERWSARVARYRAEEARLTAAETQARKAEDVANFDELVFGRSMGAGPVPHALLLAPDFASGAIAGLRQKVAATKVELAGACAWFDGPDDIESIAALVAATPRAHAGAQRERAAAEARRAQDHAEAMRLRDALNALLGRLRPHELGGALGSTETRALLRDTEERFRKVQAEAAASEIADPVMEQVRRTLRRSDRHFDDIGAALDRIEHAERVRQLWVDRGQQFLAGFIGIELMLFWSGVWPLATGLLVIVGGFFGWHRWQRVQAIASLRRSLERLPPRVATS